MAAQRSEALARSGGRKGVELRRLTQEEILAEARQTELINSAPLPPASPSMLHRSPLTSPPSLAPRSPPPP